ncbi:hypothetical protein RM554_31535, partial [Streptomyces sp. DSM 41859]|nr:hypothetical protein [Streptomyces sp. DSM 41859]
FGRAWRRKAPVESLMPLRLARYGVPLAETAPAGLAAAGIEPVLLPPAPRLEAAHEPERQAAPALESTPAPVREQLPAPTADEPGDRPQQQPQTQAQAQAQEYAEAEPRSQWLQARDPQSVAYQGGYDPTYDPDAAYREWYAEQEQAEQAQRYE